MGVKIHEHKDGHKHKVKTVAGNIKGLEFYETEHSNFGEAFGWDEAKFNPMHDAMHNFLDFVDSVERLNPELPRETKSTALASFLKSDAFKKLGIKLETPNDYFLLGWAWNHAAEQRTNPMDGLLGSLLCEKR